MRKSMVLLALVLALGQWGCQFHGGYDPNSYYQMNQLEDVYREQRITGTDYELRKGRLEIAFIFTRRRFELRHNTLINPDMGGRGIRSFDDD